MLHNSPKEEIETKENSKQTNEFYEVEMEVDKEFFGEGKVSETEISPGNFISFKYSGEKTGHGPPLHPKISFFLLLFFSWYLRFTWSQQLFSLSKSMSFCISSVLKDIYGTRGLTKLGASVT